MRSLIIHMTNAASRAANVTHLLRCLPRAQIVEAVNGRDLAQTSAVSVQPGTRHRPSYPFSLSAGEVGCFLSHRRCWQIIAEGDDPYGLIAEDDVSVDARAFANALALVERYAGEDSFIRLPSKIRERPSTIVARQNKTAMFVPKTIGLQTVCQVVGRAAARRLLAATRTIDRPVDTTLQMHWATGQQILTILPSGISELKDGSTIQAKTRASEILMREMRRVRYRAKIRRKPQAGGAVA